MERRKKQGEGNMDGNSTFEFSLYCSLHFRNKGNHKEGKM